MERFDVALVLARRMLGSSRAPVLFYALHVFLRAASAPVWASLTHFLLLLRRPASSSRALAWFQPVGCLLRLLLSQVGVQRAEPIDLSAGNEPFHINGGRGDRTQAQVFLVVCGCVPVAAGDELLPHT